MRDAIMYCWRSALFTPIFKKIHMSNGPAKILLIQVINQNCIFLIAKKFLSGQINIFGVFLNFAFLEYISIWNTWLPLYLPFSSVFQYTIFAL